MTPKFTKESLKQSFPYIVEPPFWCTLINKDDTPPTYDTDVMVQVVALDLNKGKAIVFVGDKEKGKFSGMEVDFDRIGPFNITKASPVVTWEREVMPDPSKPTFSTNNIGPLKTLNNTEPTAPFNPAMGYEPEIMGQALTAADLENFINNWSPESPVWHKEGAMVWESRNPGKNAHQEWRKNQGIKEGLPPHNNTPPPLKIEPATLNKSEWIEMDKDVLSGKYKSIPMPKKKSKHPLREVMEVCKSLAETMNKIATYFADKASDTEYEDDDL